MVLESFLITSRETLEASLVVGIVMTYLIRTNNHKFKKSVYYAVAFGILGSILGALLFNQIAGGFEGTVEKVFEGITMLAGSLLIATMMFWMKNK